MNLAFDAAKGAFKARGDVKSSAAKQVRLSIVVGQGCDLGIAQQVKAGLRPKTESCRLYIAGLSQQGHAPAVHSMASAAILLAGADAAGIADIYRAYREHRVPCLVILGLDDASGRAAALVAREVHAEDVVVCDERTAQGVLADWLLQSLPDAELSLGTCLPCCQEAIARRIVGEAVRNNAMVGALTFLRGADTPAMLACEVAMLFKLASAYGVPVNRDRVAEVACLVVYSLACKRVAGLALRAPLPAAVVKAGVAACATWLAGAAAQRRMRDLSADSNDQSQGA